MSDEERRPPKLLWIVVGLCVVFGGFYAAEALGLGGRSKCEGKARRHDPGHRCAIEGEVVPLADGQRELGTLQEVSLVGEGDTYNQFNVRDETGIVTIHFVAAAVPLPPTGRRVRVDVRVAKVGASPNVLVAEDWDFLDTGDREQPAK